MKADEKLWALRVDTDEPYENWEEVVAVFRSLEALEAYKESHPLKQDEGAYFKYVYLEPIEVEFFYD